MALVMGKQCCNNARWKKLLYPENSGLYLIPIMQLKKMAGKNIEKNYALPSSEGLTHPSTSLCRPQGLFFFRKREKGKEERAFILRGAYAPIAMIVSPFGLSKNHNLLNLLNLINPLNPINLLNLLNLINPLNLF